MTSQTVLKVLRVFRSAKLTQSLKEEYLHNLATMSSELEFAANQIIYQAGDFGKAIYIIETGQVVIERTGPDHEPINILTLGPGQSFGWSSLYPYERATTTVRATEPTRLIAINADRMRAALWS